MNKPRYSSYFDDTNNLIEGIKNQYYNLVLIVGVLLIALSSAIFGYQSDLYRYWGGVFNSLAFQLVGLVLIYVYIKWLSQLSNPTEKQNKQKITFVGLITLSVTTLIVVGAYEDAFSSFWIVTLENFSLEIIGATIIYFFVEKFLELLQKQEQQLSELKSSKRKDHTRDFVSTRKELDILKQNCEALEIELNYYKSLKTQVKGVLSEYRSVSLGTIERELAHDSKMKVPRSDLLSVLGSLQDDKELTTDNIGYYLLRNKEQE